MGARSALVSDALEIIRNARILLRENSSILASPEDCAFFRTHYASRRELPSKREPALENKIEITAVKPPSPPTPPQITTPEPPRSAPASPAASTSSKEEEFSYLRKLFADLGHAGLILDQVPTDAKARRIAEQWKTKNQAAKCSLLSFHEPALQQRFMEKLAQALDVVFGHARVVPAEPIEKANQWEAFLSAEGLSLVIVCDYTLWQLPNLLQFYREVPSRSERLLLNAQLFLLPDLTLYLKDPLLKRSLWRALCQKISG